MVPDPAEAQINPNVWASKPAWCQPWTIALTGAGIVGAAWQLSHSLLWTAVACVPVGAWWVLFLVIMPQQFRAYAEQVNQRTG